ncbi:MAG: hypothetical protein QW700_07930 [Desulfurococcaceae archaeon]
MELECNNFHSSTGMLHEILRKHLDDVVFFSAGGGLRILTFMVFIALVSLKKSSTLRTREQYRRVHS